MTVTRLRARSARPSVSRPHPPEHLARFAMGDDVFLAAPDVEAWARATFIAPDAILRNDEHAHLRFARIGFLWTNVPNGRHGKSIIGMCEACPPHVMGKWARGRAEQQIRAFWPDLAMLGGPDFIITLYAPYCAKASDASFAALVEHELYHAGQEIDEFGNPKFTKAGTPKFAMRGHDIEEFVGVVKRYGAKAAGAAVFAEALKAGPTIAQAELDWACGVCAKVA